MLLVSALALAGFVVVLAVTGGGCVVMSDLTAEVRAALPDDARMDAYYYTFDRTGIAVVDAILSAVAVAGKGSHSTDGWTSNPGHDYYKGRPWLPDADCGADLIQATADRSAALILALCDRLDAAEAKLAAAKAALSPHTTGAHGG